MLTRSRSTQTTTAFITGGLGLIGSFIARDLIDHNVVNKVVLLDHFGRYVSSVREGFVDYRRLRIHGVEDRVVIERGEVKYAGVLFELLERHKPELVFHLAALPLAKLPNLNTQEALDGAVSSTSLFLETIALLKKLTGWEPSRFIYASSSMVYGDFQSTSADESHPTNPKEIYGTMKLAGENITLGLAKYYKIASTIVRPSAVYGPTDMNRRVTQIFLERAIDGEVLEIQGADEALDFTYVKDIARGFVLAATMPHGADQVFNITAGQAHTLLDFVRELEKHFPDLRYTLLGRDETRPRRGTLSIEKASKLIGYQPLYDLGRGVAEYVAFAQKHYRKY